jgi:uncharacterized OB-fold protein
MPDISPMSQPYWEGTKSGELRLRRCNACGTLFRFVRALCPSCWSNDLGWIAARGTGVVIARAIVATAPYPSMEGRAPYVLALIELEEGVTMMANVLDCDPSEVFIGMSVTCFFEQRGDVALPQFRPVDSSKQPPAR